MSQPMKPGDPAYWMLHDGFTTTPVEGIYRESCYICRDPEFAQMGLPLCYPCPLCGGHVAADDTVCDDCGHDVEEERFLAEMARQRRVRKVSTRGEVLACIAAERHMEAIFGATVEHLARLRGEGA